MEKCTIPVLFDGQIRRVKNVTRYATCRDVMHKLLADLHRWNTADDFSMFEVTGELERMLSDKERVIQVLRSWGLKRANFQFVMKPRVYELCQNSVLSADASTDDLDKTLTAACTDSPSDVVVAAERQSRVTAAYLDSLNLEKGVDENQRLGKLSVLRRFFTDLPVHDATRQKTMRGHGAGAQKSDCGYNTTDISEDRTLDMAFVNSYRDVFADEGIDVDSITFVDLNTAFIGNFANVTKSEESVDYGFESDADRDSVSDVSHGDSVRKLFDFGGKTSVTSQDAELESFMNTRIYDSDNDEGVSSFGSDVIVVRKETSV